MAEVALDMTSNDNVTEFHRRALQMINNSGFVVYVDMEAQTFSLRKKAEKDSTGS